MNRTVQFVIGLLAVVLAAGAGLVGRNAYLREVSTYPIPVPVTTIPPYTVLSSRMFQMRDMPRSLASLPYYQSLADLNGLIATSSLPAGLPVAKVAAVPPSQFRLAEAGFEVVSIPVEPVSAVGGQVRIGQRINLYQAIAQTGDASGSEAGAQIGNAGFQVEKIAGEVLVVDVRTAQGVAAGTDPSSTHSGTTTSSGSQAVEQVQILTLALEPDRVQVVLDAVAAAKKQGGLLWTTLAIP
jgi:hypothetical protein